jgi:hypothetical protein
MDLLQQMEGTSSGTGHLGAGSRAAAGTPVVALQNKILKKR